MKFSDYLIGNQGGEQMSSQTPIQPQQMQSIAPQQSMQSSVTDFGIKPNQSAPKKKVDTFDVLGMLEKTNQFTQQAIKDNPVSKGNTVYTGRNKNIREIQEGIEQSTKETHKLNTLLDMKRYIDDGATLEEFQADFGDVPQEILPQIYEEFAYGTKMKDILKLYPELDNIQPPQKLREKYDIKKFFNPLGEAGKTILKAKEKAKEDGSFLTSNPLTQGFMGTVGGVVKSVGDLGAGIVGISDKINSLGRSITEGGDIDQYSERPSSLSEDVFNTVSGGVGTVGSVFAMPASILINTGIEALPRDYQVALSDSMDWLGDKIAQTPGLKQWMESLPVERQNEFKQELANAGFGLLIGLKGKKNIITDPKLFLKENINPIAIAKNFNENVMGIPSKALETAVSTVGKMKIPEIDLGISNKTRGVKNFVAKKLIDSKFKFTKPNKDAIRKASGLETSDFILENNLTANNVDEMIDKTKDMVDNAMSEKFKALEKVDTPQKITARDRLIGNSIVNQAKNDISEVYGKKFDEITPDEIIPELQEQFDIIKNIEETLKGKDTTALKLEAMKSLYDMYNSHLKYDPTKKRILSSAEKIRLGLQSDIEKLGETVDADIKGLNKKIAGGKALEKGLIQAGDRMDNNNIFGLSDSQTAILGSVLGGGGVGVATVLGAKSIFENIGVRGKIAQSLYSKSTNEGLESITNTPSNRTTAGSNITKQFGNSNTTMNDSKSSIQVIKPKSDTLASKSDIMEAERLANLDYENNMSNPERIQSIAIGKEKQFKEFMKKLSKEGKVNPFTLESDIKMVKEGVLGERASKNILEERDKYISKQTKSPSTTKSETPSLKTAPSKELQPLYEEAKKYKSSEDYLEGLRSRFLKDMDILTEKAKKYNPTDPTGYETAKSRFLKDRGITDTDMDLLGNNKYADIKGMEDTYKQYVSRGQNDFALQQKVKIENAKKSNNLFDKYDKIMDDWDEFFKRNEKKILMQRNKRMTNEEANKVLLIKNMPNVSELRKIREEANRKSDTLVSKTDSMNNKRYIDKIERTEKTKPISESEMKRNNLTPIKNLKGENTGRYENKSLNQGAGNRTIYSKEGDIVTFKKDDSYKIGYAIDNQIKSNYTVPEGDIITTDLYNNKPSIGNKLDDMKANKDVEHTAFAKSKDITNEQIGYKKKELSTRALESIQFEGVYISELRKKNTRYIEKYGIDKFNEEALQKYKDNVKYYISKGYDVPQKIIDKYPEFSKSVDARARYEKGLYTSFSNKDIRIDKEAMDKIGGGIKRQDGKELTVVQKDEIIKGVQDFSDTLGIDMKKIAQENNIVFVHLNGKNAFLRKASGLHRKSGDSYSISVGGKETITEVVNGKRVTEQLNTTMQHELGHAIDGLHGNRLLGSVVRDATRTYNPVDYLRKYFRKDEEITARLIEQYVAVKKGHTSYYDKPGFWKKEKFDELLPRIEDKIREKFPTI